MASAHEQGAAIRRHIMQEAGHGKSAISLSISSFANKLEQVLWLRGSGKGFRVEQSVADIRAHIDIAPVEAFVQQAAVRDDISGENNTARLCYAERLPQRLLLVPLGCRGGTAVPSSR